MKLRLANINDSDFLFKWSNDPQTRKASGNRQLIQREEHEEWLRLSLQDPDKQIFIAEEKGIPVGIVRVHHQKGTYELSWTVSPHARGRKIGKNIVAQIASRIQSPIKAVIHKDNVASIKIAKYAGMSLKFEEDDIMHWWREGLNDGPVYL
jgi:RimJ/RimL family protein N-acetyltransferase